MPNQQLVPYNRRRNNNMVLAARAIAPAIARQVAQRAVNAAYNYLPSMESVGSSVRKFARGYRSSSAAAIEDKRASERPMTAPVAVSNTRISRSAQITTRKGCTTITHRELVDGAVSGSTVWTLQDTYDLQPGNAVTFPWLSSTANQYAEYSFRKLTFEYVPFCATSTAGGIILTPDYDSSNPPPTSEAMAVDHKDCIVDSVWKDIRCNLSVRDMHALGPRKFTRAFLAAGDIKTFDCGKLYVSTDNCAGSNATGKLFVSYTVDLFTPVLIPTAIQPRQCCMFYNSSAQSFTNGIVQRIKFDTAYSNTWGLCLF